MADELTVSCGFTCALGGATIDTGTIEDTHTPSATGMGGATQSILHTADAALAIPADIVVPALLMVRNLDATNFVEFSNATGGSFAGGKFAKIRAGDPPMLLPLSATTIYAQADTATVQIEFKVIRL